MHAVKKMGMGFIFIFAFILSISSIIRYFILDPVETNAILIEQGMEMFELKSIPWNVALYIHIITAVLSLIIGPFLFIKKWRNKYLNTHRKLGKIYVISIIISSLVGIYLSLFAFGGTIAKIGFICLDVAWLFTTMKAYKHIRNKQLKLHEQWMYRSYAVTFAAITFRIWSAAIGYTLDDFTLGYVAAIWLSWTVNLLLIEIWIRKSQSIKMDRSNTVLTEK